MNFGIPQIILIAIHAMGLGIAMIKNGEPRDGKYSFFGVANINRHYFFDPMVGRILLKEEKTK